MNDEPFDKESLRAMVVEAQNNLNFKEKIMLSCLVVGTITVCVALIALTYTLAKHANIF